MMTSVNVKFVHRSCLDYTQKNTPGGSLATKLTDQESLQGNTEVV
jgi:hypothetical protein